MYIHVNILKRSIVLVCWTLLAEIGVLLLLSGLGSCTINGNKLDTYASIDSDGNTGTCMC